MLSSAILTVLYTVKGSNPWVETSIDLVCEAEATYVYRVEIEHSDMHSTVMASLQPLYLQHLKVLAQSSLAKYCSFKPLFRFFR